MCFFEGSRNSEKGLSDKGLGSLMKKRKETDRFSLRKLTVNLDSGCRREVTAQQL